MKIYGLIGYPLGHSWSPNFFNDKFNKDGLDAEYQLFSLESIDMFPTLLKQRPDLAGLNVTIPYKQAIIPYLDELSQEASAIGAVNTIVFQNGKLIGHNTDAFGFASTLDQFSLSPQTEALVLGTGGSSLAVKYILEQRNIPYLTISRDKMKGQLTYDELTTDIITAHNLIVNCTPVGMHPNTKDCLPLPFSGITDQHVVIDLIYNPEQTELLRRATAQKAKTTNGLHMLQQQALKAWQLW